MRAIILAGGRGTRLRPLTDKIPKALIPVAGVPMIERSVRSLKQAGITEIIIVVSYKADMIKNYFAKKIIGTKIRFVKKDVKNKYELFLLLRRFFQHERFLLFAADHIFEPQTLIDFLNKTKKVDADLIISTCKHGKMDEYKVIVDEQCNVINIRREDKRHYEVGFVLYSTKVFGITDKIDKKIKDSVGLIKLLLNEGYRIKAFKTPEVYDIDNIYSLKKIGKIVEKKELKWSFWVIPPTNIKKQLSKIISQINKKYKVLIPPVPHITVKNEVMLYKKDRKIVENIFRKVCNNTKPFEIELGKIKHSSKSHKPIFFDVKKTQQLLKFHNDLADKLYQFSVKLERDFKNFEPHLSLAYRNLNIKMRLRIIKDVKKKIDSCKFFVDKAHIVISSSDPKDWKILKSFKLGG